jgi:CRP-like cAMP-binding protein
MLAGADVDRLHGAFRELAELPREQVERLAHFGRRLRLPPGAFFVRCDEQRTILALLTSGLLRCYLLDARGREYTKHFFRPGELVESSSNPMTGDPPAPHDIQALEASELLAVDMRAAREVLGSHPGWMELWVNANRRANQAEQQRSAAFALEDPETRYRAFLREYPGLEARVKGIHLASYLGITPVSLSRIRARLNNR